MVTHEILLNWFVFALQHPWIDEVMWEKLSSLDELSTPEGKRLFCDMYPVQFDDGMVVGTKLTLDSSIPLNKRDRWFEVPKGEEVQFLTDRLERRLHHYGCTRSNPTTDCPLCMQEGWIK